VEILLVSGIWPPDVGGPASHGPEFGQFLVARGHKVRAVTIGEGADAVDPGFEVTRARRDRPRPLRLPAAALAVVAAAPRADVIYGIGMYTRSAMASSIVRTPLVLKLSQDPAYERALTLGAFSGTLEQFQEPHSSPVVRALKRARQWSVRRASRIIIPSRYLAEIARGWGLPEGRVSVVPNPAHPVDLSITREELRERLGLSSPTIVFAGRLVPAKNVPLAISALRDVPAASLVVIGDGPDRDALTGVIAESGLADRVRMMGALPRPETIEWLRAADAAVLPSDWENFPHAAVEALAAGTPVIATSVGGVPEIIETGVNGILISPGDAPALGRAIASVIEDPALLERLREGARNSAGRYDRDVVFEALERELTLAAPAAGAPPPGGANPADC
jgi:glycosyltransferase involved in cell wall biosynthesis